MDDRLALTGPMRRTEERLGRPLADELRDRYHGRGQTMDEIAEALGVAPVTIHRWMQRLSIEARFPGQRGTPEAVA